MRRWSAIAVVLLLLAGLVRAQSATQPSESARFASVNVYVDPKGQPLAAYQFELTAETGDVAIVGIEGGEHPAFKEPPYYDPEALSHKRIIIAAFSTASNLPTARTRVARVHVRIAGPAKPRYAIKLDVAADADGKPIPAAATVSQPL